MKTLLSIFLIFLLLSCCGTSTAHFQALDSEGNLANQGSVEIQYAQICWDVTACVSPQRCYLWVYTEGREQPNCVIWCVDIKKNWEY